jgi:hypothetical protein
MYPIFKKFAILLPLFVLIASPLVATASSTPVQLYTGQVTTSVWDTDPTMIGFGLQIGNTGYGTASNVNVTRLEIQGAAIRSVSPTKFDLIREDEKVNITGTIQVPRTDGSHYRMLIEGQYFYAGTTYSFSLNRDIVPTPASNQAPIRVDGSMVVKRPSTSSYPKNPPEISRLPNAEIEGKFLLPPGPQRQLFPQTPNSTPARIASSSSSVQFNVNKEQIGDVGWPPDPSGASTNDGIVISTYNTGISYSLDGGKNFKDVSLSSPVAGRPSFFPNDDGGLCCDQVVIYVPRYNLYVWALQYWWMGKDKDIPCDISDDVTKHTGFHACASNRLRIAWATPEALRADFNNAWFYADLTPEQRNNIDSGVGLTKTSVFDYPDLSYSNNFLYVNTDWGEGVDNSCCTYFNTKVLVRMNLAEMADSSSSLIHYNARVPQGTAGNYNKARFVQNAPGRMVLGARKDSSTFTIISWRDNAVDPVETANIPISATKAATDTDPDYSSLAPDNFDWNSAAVAGQTSGGTHRSFPAIANNPAIEEYEFAFDAGRDARNGRPMPYVRLLSTNLLGDPINSDNFVATSEYDIFHPDYAYGMGILATQGDDVGIGVAVGGGSVIGFPQYAVGYKFDFEVFYPTNSNATQSAWVQADNNTDLSKIEGGKCLNSTGAIIPPNAKNPQPCFNSTGDKAYTLSDNGKREALGRFGDYFHLRPVASTSEFSAEVYSVLQAVPGQVCAQSACKAVMRYIRFGRSTLPPPLIH